MTAIESTYYANYHNMNEVARACTKMKILITFGERKHKPRENGQQYYLGLKSLNLICNFAHIEK